MTQYLLFTVVHFTDFFTWVQMTVYRGILTSELVLCDINIFCKLMLGVVANYDIFLSKFCNEYD